MNFFLNTYRKTLVVSLSGLMALAMTIPGQVIPGPAQISPREKGLMIAVEADKRDTGWMDMKADVTMHLVNRHGEESLRRLRMKSLEQEADGDRSLVIFDDPRDVKGTALLSYTHCLKPDDQWLFLPALKRIKRISTANKSGPFLGSEFAFEDMTSQEIEKYTYAYLRNEMFNGNDCFVLERVPAYAKSGYTKQVVWCDVQEYRIIKIVFYDRKSERLKTLAYSGYTQYMDRYWRAEKMHMENHQTGKSTSLIWRNYQFKNGFGPNHFTRNVLKRIR